MSYALERYIDRLIDSHPKYVFGTDKRTRYTVIWKKLPGSSFRSAVAFVDESTGDVYRADSWKKKGRLLTNLNQIGASRDRYRRRARRRR